jgi:hypothetical protein
VRRPLATLPDHLGTTLLHAALDQPERAAGAWSSARPQLDLALDAAPTEHHGLLPLVGRNLGERLPAADRSLVDARSARTRARNEAHLGIASRWVALLELGGVTASVLKGIPLALRDYGDLAVRPMSDVDLLVPPEQADRALDLLEGAGWYDGGGCSREVLARLYHGSGMLHPDGGSLDVHWRLSGFLDQAFEPRIEPISLGERGATTLDRTDTLLHVVLHGAWHGSAASVRWVADAVTVLRAAHERGVPVDGTRLAAVADHHGVGAILGDALAHLEREHEAPVPAGLVAELRGQPVGWLTRHRQRVVTAPTTAPDRITGLTHLRSYWAYTRWRWSGGHAVRTFPAFLAELWGLESTAALPATLASRPLRRLARRR